LQQAKGGTKHLAWQFRHTDAVTAGSIQQVGSSSTALCVSDLINGSCQSPHLDGVRHCQVPLSQAQLVLEPPDLASQVLHLLKVLACTRQQQVQSVSLSPTKCQPIALYLLPNLASQVLHLLKVLACTWQQQVQSVSKEEEEEEEGLHKVLAYRPQSVSLSPYIYLLPNLASQVLHLLKVLACRQQQKAHGVSLSPQMCCHLASQVLHLLKVLACRQQQQAQAQKRIKCQPVVSLFLLQVCAVCCSHVQTRHQQQERQC
jgi:hypothetical protein